MEQKHSPAMDAKQLIIFEILERSKDQMLSEVVRIVRGHQERCTRELVEAGETQPLASFDFFASVVHHHMYCIVCGADPDTMEGGNAEIAYAVIRNHQNIAKHYWEADLEPYPS